MFGVTAVSLAFFSLGWITFIYIINSLIAGRLKKTGLKRAAVYFSTVALIGLFGEFFLDGAYNFIVGHPLWEYRILPLKNGYTSSFAVITWGIYGLHLYLLHDSLASKWRITRTRHLALIFSLEALVLEAALTISARFFLGDYLYYYLPGDLWHVSSLQNVPFYFICGVVVLKTLRRFRNDPVFFTIMNTSLLIVLISVTGQ